MSSPPPNIARGSRIHRTHSAAAECSSATTVAGDQAAASSTPSAGGTMGQFSGRRRAFPSRRRCHLPRQVRMAELAVPFVTKQPIDRAWVKSLLARRSALRRRQPRDRIRRAIDHRNWRVVLVLAAPCMHLPRLFGPPEAARRERCRQDVVASLDHGMRHRQHWPSPSGMTSSRTFWAALVNGRWGERTSVVPALARPELQAITRTAAIATSDAGVSVCFRRRSRILQVKSCRCRRIFSGMTSPNECAEVCPQAAEDRPRSQRKGRTTDCGNGIFGARSSTSQPDGMR